MYNKFSSFPGAIENTRKIADMCDFEIPMGKLHLPKFPIPQKYQTDDPDEYLRIVCEGNIKLKYDKIDSKVIYTQGNISVGYTIHSSVDYIIEII